MRALLKHVLTNTQGHTIVFKLLKVTATTSAIFCIQQQKMSNNDTL